VDSPDGGRTGSQLNREPGAQSPNGNALGVLCLEDAKGKVRTMAQTTVEFRVVLDYDPADMTEHEAQDTALQGFPDRIQQGNGISVWGVKVHFVEVVRGLVDEDGVPAQPRVDKDWASVQVKDGEKRVR
jgi:hypothetical protein